MIEGLIFYVAGFFVSAMISVVIITKQESISEGKAIAVFLIFTYGWFIVWPIWAIETLRLIWVRRSAKKKSHRFYEGDEIVVFSRETRQRVGKLIIDSFTKAAMNGQVIFDEGYKPEMPYRIPGPGDPIYVRASFSFRETESGTTWDFHSMSGQHIPAGIIEKLTDPAWRFDNMDAFAEFDHNFTYEGIIKIVQQSMDDSVGLFPRCWVTDTPTAVRIDVESLGEEYA